MNNASERVDDLRTIGAIVTKRAAKEWTVQCPHCLRFLANGREWYRRGTASRGVEWTPTCDLSNTKNPGWRHPYGRAIWLDARAHLLSCTGPDYDDTPVRRQDSMRRRSAMRTPWALRDSLDEYPELRAVILGELARALDGMVPADVPDALNSAAEAVRWKETVPNGDD